MIFESVSPEERNVFMLSSIKNITEHTIFRNDAY